MWLSRTFLTGTSSQVHDYIKPQLYLAIGDIALAIGAGMDKYLSYWLAALQQGCDVAKALRESLKEGYDEDKRNYLNAMYDGIFHGYTGIVQGLKVASKTVPGATEAFLQPIALQGGSLMLVEVASTDEDKVESAVHAVVGLLGDLADTYGDKIRPVLQAKPCADIMMQAKSIQDPDLQELVKWATGKLGM